VSIEVPQAPKHHPCITMNSATEELPLEPAVGKPEHLGHKTRPGHAKGEAHGSKTRPHRVARGERSGNAKLTDANVTAMRALRTERTITYLELGRLFGVSKACAHKAVTRFGWKHIT